MERVETSRFTRSISGYLNRIAQGEAFILTRYGKEVAAIGPPNMTMRKGEPKAPPLILEVPDDLPRAEGAPDEPLRGARTPR